VRKLHFFIILTIALLMVGACAITGTPSLEVAADRCGSDQATPSVEIVPPEPIKALIANGQKMNFSADVQPIQVSFQWKLTGEGRLLNPNNRTVQYEAPKSVRVEEGVTLSVTVTDQETNCQAIDDINIQLLPPPTPTLPPTNTPTPAPTNTPTVEPAKPPPTNTPTLTDTPTLTPTPVEEPASACAAQPSLLSPLPASETVLAALRIDQPPEIDGCLNEEIWAYAQPLTYAVHPPANYSTTMTVWLAWDDRYLYAAFDVNDTQVEESFLPDNVYDGDSVGVIIENGGRIREYRLTMRGAPDDRQQLDPDRAGTTNSQTILEAGTTLNKSDDQDQGYTVEMRIPWENPAPTEGSIIPADLWSIDHDHNPGKWWDDPATVFGKISWDGDLNVTTAGKSILLTPRPSATATSANGCPFGAPIRDPITGPPVEEQAYIASTHNCTDDLPIDTLFPLSGTYTGDLTGKELWILAYTPNLRYFPQAADICANQSTPLAAGQWRETIRLGGPGSPSEIYHVVAVVADSGSPASQAFHNYLETGCEEGTYEGLVVIPAGATELDSIIVRTNTPRSIELSPAVFERQASNQESGIVDEFILITRDGGIPGLPVQDGVDLSNYDLEFTFRGAEGQHVHLFYKSGPNYANAVSSASPIGPDQPVRFNPSVDDNESDPGFDFAHIWAIGARMPGGIGEVELTSVRLIKR
jgi:hypothetical protein